MDKSIFLDFSRDWRKYGLLGYGYEGANAVAEALMRKIISLDYLDEEFEVKQALAGNSVDLSMPAKEILSPLLESHGGRYKLEAAFKRVFVKCVYLGVCFEKFLEVCAETKLMDGWFLSEAFISDVWAGDIHGKWEILSSHENGDKRPYRRRFRKFVKSLDERGLHWTEKYLEPDWFWKVKRAYWLEEEQ